MIRGVDFNQTMRMENNSLIEAIENNAVDMMCKIS